MNELPIPHHLKDILVPQGDDNDGYAVTGPLRCNCGSEDFSVLYHGDASDFEETGSIRQIRHKGKTLLAVRAKCLKCGREHPVFDDTVHGWNGFVCHDDACDTLQKPAENVWKCPKCGNESLNIRLRIDSAGKEDFLEETDGEFEANDWTEAFEWITIGLKCSACGHEDTEWVSTETM